MRYWSVSPVTTEEWALIQCEIQMHDPSINLTDIEVVSAGETVLFFNPMKQSITINPSHIDIIPSIQDLLS